MTLFWPFFDPFLDPKSYVRVDRFDQKGGPKRGPKWPLFDPFLTPFWPLFWPFFGPQIVRESRPIWSKRGSEYGVQKGSKKGPKRVILTPFWPLFDPFLDPLFGPKCTIFTYVCLEKGVQKGVQNDPPKSARGSLPVKIRGFLKVLFCVLNGKTWWFAFWGCFRGSKKGSKKGHFGPFFGPLFWTHIGHYPYIHIRIVGIFIYIHICSGSIMGPKGSKKGVLGHWKTVILGQKWVFFR